jgi:hypothetical protein
MTISICLFNEPYQLIEVKTLKKLNLAHEILNFYSRYFYPTRIEIWHEAPVEALGGELLKEIRWLDDYYEKMMLIKALDPVIKKPDLLISMTLLFRGVWKINEVKVPGYISVNNIDSSIRTYGDIELGSYSQGKFSDIVDLIWTDYKKVQFLVNDFISKFSKFKDETNMFYLVNYIIFGPGAALVQPITEWTASYHKNPVQFVSKVLSELKKPTSDVYSYLRLIYSKTMAVELYNIDDFKKNLKAIADKNDVELDAGSSLKLVGKELKSYKNMINALMSFLKPVLIKSLPEDKVIIKKLISEMAGQLTLD